MGNMSGLSSSQQKKMYFLISFKMHKNHYHSMEILKLTKEITGQFAVLLSINNLLHSICERQD